MPGVLDDLYGGAADRELGVTWLGGRPTLSLWAPTAQDVDRAGRRPGGCPCDASRTALDRRPGRRLDGAAYTYEVVVWAPDAQEVVTNRVTDPYTVALTANSTRSVDGRPVDPALTPRAGPHDAHRRIAQPEDRTIYELHVRDFSIGDETVPAAERGTYLAFTHDDTDGMHHLRRLADAGLNTVHLLPAFDIATIEERRSAQQVPDCDLAAMAPDSEEQQDCIDAVRGEDGFNWGYDPLHYTAPEGSYATDPEGARRTVEFRRMVQGLHGIGLRVVMDVVYNHTAAPGQAANSVLDRIVPGYYQRLDATGAVESSTCCSNTATEHADDGEADDRLHAHVGAGLQGRRLPVRPDGPPQQAEHAATCGPRSTG